MKNYFLNMAQFSNHGCEDTASFQSTDGITAVCTDSTSCHNCWQVGHDGDHCFFQVGDVVSVAELLSGGAEEE